MDKKINLNLTKPLNYTGSELSKKAEVKEEAQTPKIELNHKSAEQILSAMETMGLANKAQLGFAGEVDPKKYLSPQRIADIQKSMVAFEGGVAKHQATLEEEFGFLPEYSSLSDADKLEMAAKAFTAEDAA